MVTTPSTLSAQFARKIMDKKGNVVDVAVGVALILAVTNPRHASLGGGGFALVKMGKDPVKALDFRETAPALTHKKYYLNKPRKASFVGGHSIGVPGIPAGLWTLHKKYGKLHWSQLFDEPIRLAKKGHFLTGENVKKRQSIKDQLNPSGKKIFLDKNGKVQKPGTLFRQKQLAKALKEMRNRGIVPFYEGSISRDIVKTVKKAGGVLSKRDLKKYKVRWLDPIITDFQGYKLYLMPPPSSGGLIIASSLKMLGFLKSQNLEPLSTKELHYFAEVMKISFFNRNLLGDPDFNANPISEFLDKDKNKTWAGKIKENKLLKINPVKNISVNESKETTHISVLDHRGNAVSMTITLNSVFGSKVVSKKYGIVLNNEMDDFTTRLNEKNLLQLVQGAGNQVEPGKRPLSSMSPTLVEKGGKIVMSLGAPGGPRIITGVLQSLYRVLANNYNMEEAIHAPRVHHQYKPDKIFIDGHGKLPPLSIQALKKLGHKIEKSWGAVVNGIRINEEGFLEAGFDYRGEGGAGGY